MRNGNFVSLAVPLSRKNGNFIFAPVLLRFLKLKKDMAVREEGIVVSNDQFRDLITDSPEYAKCIEERLLPYVFMEDYIMLCKDPPRAGEVVPLEQFIRH